MRSRRVLPIGGSLCRELAALLVECKEPTGDDVMAEFLRQQYRQDRLHLGAAGRVEGLEVRPADDAEAMEAANPVKGGKVAFDATATEKREKAIVRNVLASDSPVAMVILGGGHDLAEHVPEGVEIVRVGVSAYRGSGRE